MYGNFYSWSLFSPLVSFALTWRPPPRGYFVTGPHQLIRKKEKTQMSFQLLLCLRLSREWNLTPDNLLQKKKIGHRRCLALNSPTLTIHLCIPYLFIMFSRATTTRTPPLPSWNRKWKGHFLRAKLKCRINSKRRGRAAHVWLFRQ